MGMQTRRLTKAARRYWKFLLILAILLQLFLMLKDFSREDKEPQKIVIFQNAMSGNSSPPAVSASFCPSITFASCANTIFLQSGLANKALPIMCLNSVELFGRTSAEIAKDKAESQRGVHAVVLGQGAGLPVLQKRVFDTYNKDAEFIDFLISTVHQGDILLLASFDDMSVSLSQTARGILTQHFGSQEVESLKIRDNYVMMGQKGLSKGFAFEQTIRKRGNENFPAETAKVAVCAKFPLGPIEALPPEGVLRAVNKQSHLGVMFNCGLDNTCDPFYSVPVWISTGVQNVDGPELCINSHLVFHPLIKLGGSGYNLAQYDPITQTVITRDRFNTASEGESRLEIFIGQIPEEHLIFGVIHEDGSRRAPILSFLKFGVTIIDQFRFRSVGFFVAQRGAERAIQSIGHKESSSDFAAQITFRGCIPRQIKGIHYSKGSIPDSNIEHRFCGVNGITYDQTCAQAKLNPEQWLPQTSPKVDSHKLDTLKVPIFIMAGNDATSLQKCLESLANQVILAADPTRVTVAASHLSIEFDDIKKYVVAYGFKFLPCNSECNSYNRLYSFILQKAAENTSSSAFIFLEPEVILSPDFLAATSAFLFSEHVSPEIVGISGWNHNGFSHLSAESSGISLTETALPSPCLLLSTTFTKEVLIPYIATRTEYLPRYMPWFEDGEEDGKKRYFAVLEESRCFKIAPHLTTANEAGDMKALRDLYYQQPRHTSLSSLVNNDEELIAKSFSKAHSQLAFDNYLVGLLKRSSNNFDPNDRKICELCQADESLLLESRTIATILFNDWSQLEAVADCCKLHGLVVNLKSAEEGKAVKQPGFGFYQSSYLIKTKFMDFLLISDKSPIYSAFHQEAVDRKQDENMTLR